MLLFDHLRVRFSLLSRGIIQCAPLDSLGESTADVVHKIIDVMVDSCEKVLTGLQPLEEIYYFLGRITLSKLLFQLGHQENLILKLKLRIGFDLLFQTIQIGNWSRWRLRQWIGQRRGWEQTPESSLQF